MARAEHLPRLPGGLPHAVTSARWWPLAQRCCLGAFLCVVAALLYVHARKVDWPQVWSAVRAYPGTTLLLAAGLAAASHAVYATYDLVGRRFTRHGLSAAQVMGVGWVSYAFNLNFGSLVGGVGFRYRLYSRLGLDAAVIARIFGLSLLTNWLGYVAVAGGAFLGWPPELPPQWALDSDSLPLLGVVLQMLAVVYLLLCALSLRRSWTLRRFTLELPSGRMALLQLVLSACNWMLMGGVLYTLLGHGIEYPTVLAVLLVAAVLGAAAHVPAGLGVVEAVFVALLAHRMPAHELLAALLTYRALYYLAPLVLALCVYAVLEARMPKLPVPREENGSARPAGRLRIPPAVQARGKYR